MILCVIKSNADSLVPRASPYQVEVEPAFRDASIRTMCYYQYAMAPPTPAYARRLAALALSFYCHHAIASRDVSAELFEAATSCTPISRPPPPPPARYRHFNLLAVEACSLRTMAMRLH